MKVNFLALNPRAPRFREDPDIFLDLALQATSVKASCTLLAISRGTWRFRPEFLVFTVATAARLFHLGPAAGDSDPFQRGRRARRGDPLDGRFASSLTSETE
jgi:hypothetical protein